MSIAAMTEVAFMGRRDVEPANFVPVKFSEIAGAARGKNTPEDNTDTVMQTLLGLLAPLAQLLIRRLRIGPKKRS